MGSKREMNEEEFNDFFLLVHPKIVRYALRWLDADTAAEVANDTLRSLHFKKPARPASEVEHRQLQSLCYRISEGLIQNEHRAQRRRSALFQALAEQRGTGSASLPDFTDEVVEQLALAGLLAELSAKDREVLGLLLDGYKVAEMAIVLDCTPAAATMRLQRAKKSLKQLMERDEHRRENSDGTAS